MKTYYNLEEVPSHLKTKNQLLDLGLVPTDGSEKVSEVALYAEDYNKGSILPITYDLFNITDTELIEVNDQTLNARNICKVLYELNTSDNKEIKNKKGKVKEKWDKFYSMKPEILNLLHSEGRVQLVGYQDSFKNKCEYNAYYIYHEGNVKYSFHVPIIDTEYSNISKKLFYLGKSDDNKNEKISIERQKLHNTLSDEEVSNYITFLNAFIDSYN